MCFFNSSNNNEKKIEGASPTILNYTYFEEKMEIRIKKSESN